MLLHDRLESCLLIQTDSPIKSDAPKSPERSVMKMGMYCRIPTPGVVLFADHRQPWEGSTVGTTEFCTQYGGAKPAKERTESVAVRL